MISSALLFFLLLVGVQGVRLDAFSEFQGPSGVRDDTVIAVGIGRPVITVRLRAVFSPALFNLSLHAGNILLLDSAKVRLQSATYETIVPGRLGRDIIDVDGVRWLGLIDTVQAGKGRLPSSATSGAGRNAGIDGWIYVGSRIDGHVANGFWERAHVTRHGIHWLPQGDEERNEGALDLLLPSSSSSDGSLGACLAERYDVWPVAEVEGRLLGAPVRVLVAPDHVVSYLSGNLFDAYFHDKNLHADVPELWQPLQLELAGAPVPLVISGHVLFPRQATAMHTSTAYPGALGGKVVRAIVSVEGAMASDEGGRGSLVAAASGMDNLKVLAHTCGPDVIVLGGHVLWATSGLELVYPSGLVRLIPNQTAVSLQLVDVLGLLAVLLLYLRWKLGAFWIDKARDRRDRYAFYYYHVTTADSYLAPLVSQFLIVPLLVWRHWSDLWQNLPAGRVLTYLAALAGLWLVANIVWLIFERAHILSAFRKMRKSWWASRHRRRQSSSCLRALYETFVQEEEEEEKEEEQKAHQQRHHRPTGSEVLMTVAQTSALPTYTAASSDATFAWQHLALAQLRDTLLEATLLLSLWGTLAPLESEGFAHFFSAVLFSAVAFMATLRAIVQLLLLSTGPARERPLAAVASLVALALLLLLLAIHVALRPALESLSTAYTNSDESLDVLALLFVASLLFLALTAAPRVINAFSLPKERREKNESSRPARAVQALALFDAPL